MRLENKSIDNISFIMSQSCEYRENLSKGNLLDRALMSKEGDGNKQVVSNACVSRVGNLLLLSEHINSNMGNDSFEEKKKKLGNSRLSTVKNFLKYYGNLDVWNEETIEKRTRAVAKFAYNKVWKLD